MKFIHCFFLLIIFSFSSAAYAWGDQGHRLIIKKAIEILPEELSFLNSWSEYLSARVTDPDDRKKYDKTEEPKHYIDLDYYSEFLSGEMIYDKSELIKIYGEEKVTEIGLLPWATLQSFEYLSQAFAEKDRDRILIYIADLAHYAADGHQPLHTVLNYDGQITGQKGLHFRYEIEMISKYIDELDKEVNPPYSGQVYKPLEYIFNYLSDSNFKNDIILSSDKIASLNNTVESDEYYKILWFRTRNLTTEQLNKAASSIAALIFTAWVNGGMPAAAEIK